jgi:hypothetical protein
MSSSMITMPSKLQQNDHDGSQTSSLLREAISRIQGCRRDQIQKVSVVFISLLFVLFQIFLSSSAEKVGEGATISMTDLKTDSDVRTIRQDLSSGEATLVLELKRPTSTESTSASDAVAVGQHEVKVIILNTSCKYPRFWVSLVGDALVTMDLVQGTKSSSQTWSGLFAIPFEGTYTVEARWYGCVQDGTTWSPLSSPINFRAVGPRYIPMMRPKESYLFANSAWISSKRIASAGEPLLPDYVWTDRVDGASEPDDILTLNDERVGINTAILKSGTLREPNGMYQFGEVGNYELVCFWGGPTMWDIRQTFLFERQIITPQQRPFKFHYYNITNLVYPDQDWPLSEKQRCRKCKHIFLSVDDLDAPVSQATFEEQLTTFVDHLQKLMDDPTFPIWILTVNEPPMLASSCHTPELPRSSDHPCNDVIQRLFRPGDERFPTRVHLMDNTDLVLPQLGQNRENVLANIAMRVFVAVGKGVSEWRAMGQIGLIDGLHRNDTVEPNFELVPYEGWNVT